MGAPQIIWIVLATLSLGITMGRHGETRTERCSFWQTLISNSLMFWLLWWGGFFG